MLRLAVAFLGVASLCFSQNFPAFNWITQLTGGAYSSFAGPGADAQGNVYVAACSAVCVVTKFNTSGNVVYSVSMGGNGTSAAAGIAVDAAGDVYVTGTTTSTNFPTTTGTYSPSYPPPVLAEDVGGSAGEASFLFKLNPDGSLNYSTYFATGQLPRAIAVGADGSAYIAGVTYGGLPTTPAAYETMFCCGGTGVSASEGEGFITRFNPAASRLIYSTYFGGASPVNALAVASDGSAYAGGPFDTFRLDPTGSTILAGPVQGGAQAIAIAGDGSVYLVPGPAATAGAFQPSPNPLPAFTSQPTPQSQSIARMDPLLQNVLAGTYFYALNGTTIKSMALDAAGNVYIGGSTSSGLPTRTPMYIGFGVGFLSELSGDLSTLLFSSYYGNDKYFTTQGVAVAPNGSIVIGGMDGSPYGNVFLNSIAVTAPPALRIDSIQNAASLLDVPISGGETIMIQGAGFGNDAQLLMGGVPVPVISISANRITGTVPSNVAGNAASFQVQSGGMTSNPVWVAVTSNYPGLFSANGTGYGEAYILNEDGTLNSPSHPAPAGSRITVFATGVGPVSFPRLPPGDQPAGADGYAATQFHPNLTIEGFSCDIVSAFFGPVTGLPGNVYRLSVQVPDLAPPLGILDTPPSYPVVLQMYITPTIHVDSQYGLSIAIQ